MLSKIMDGASKLKAKIGGDQLDQLLVQVVSEQNWQASTKQLHQVASAAYNYQKWQRISQFIWEKLKKSKSWKKILKTFNLIEFLLKNGPPSIISNFKYDLYQLRVFESYSNYVDGLDKGQPIRQRAKAVVALLNNQEQLEEERLKAKTIRDKIGGGGGYGSYSNSGGNSGYGGSSGYGGYDSGYSGYGHKQQKRKKKESQSSNTYNYGNSVGHFGDYTYSKSTIDKYRDTKNQKNGGNSSNYEASRKEEKRQPEVQVQTKKPFEKAASKLSKPGERKVQPVAPPPPTNVNTSTPNTTNNNNPPTSSKSENLFEMDILGGQTTTPPPQQSVPTPPQPVQPPQPVHQPQPVQPQVQPPVQSQVQQNYPQQQVNPPPQQQFNPPPQQQFNPPQQQFNPPPQQQFNPYGQTPPPQQPYGQVPQQPYGQQAPSNQYGQYGQPQPNHGYPNQQAQTGYPPQQGYNQYVNPMYPQTGPMAAQHQQQQPQQQQPQMGNITLSTGKKEDDFGNFASSNLGTAQNVQWLSNTEKGLIDFSDFGSEIKKENKPAANKNEISNNIQIDNWSW